MRVLEDDIEWNGFGAWYRRLRRWQVERYHVAGADAVVGLDEHRIAIAHGASEDQILEAGAADLPQAGCQQAVQPLAVLVIRDIDFLEIARQFSAQTPACMGCVPIAF